MKNSAKKVVENMFAAFSSGDVDKICGYSFRPYRMDLPWNTNNPKRRV